MLTGCVDRARVSYLGISISCRVFAPQLSDDEGAGAWADGLGLLVEMS